MVIWPRPDGSELLEGPTCVALECGWEQRLLRLGCRVRQADAPDQFDRRSNDVSLSSREKRAILSAWASQAHAQEAIPSIMAKECATAYSHPGFEESSEVPASLAGWLRSACLWPASATEGAMIRQRTPQGGLPVGRRAIFRISSNLPICQARLRV